MNSILSKKINFAWSDVVSGLSIAGLLLPEAVAYSGIANLPPQAGLIALLAGLLCYGIFGRSRFAIVAATSSSAALVAAVTTSLSIGNPAHRLELAVGLVLLTGVGFLVAGLTRIGGITQFIARPVLNGFTFGLALLIIIKQVAVIAGIHLIHSDIARSLIQIFSHIANWNFTSLIIGISSLAMLFLLGRHKRIPGAFVVIVVGITAGKWLNIAQFQVELVGPISLEMSAFKLPNLSQIEWLRLTEMSAALVLVLYAESYGAIRSLAIKYGESTSPNRDLLALGVANILSGLLHGMPVGVGYSATSANEAAGAKSRWSGWVAAAVLCLMAATLLSSIALTPHPVLAAIVIHALSHTLKLATFRPYFLWQRDRIVVIAAVFAVVFLGVLDGLLAAIGISLLLMLRQLSRSTVTVLGRLENGHDYVSLTLHPEAQAVSGVLILRPEEALFFANVENIFMQAQQQIENINTIVDTVIVSLEESPDLDSSSLQSLHEFSMLVLSKNRQLIFARLKQPVYAALVNLFKELPHRPYLTELSVDDAVQSAIRLRQESAFDEVLST